MKNPYWKLISNILLGIDLEKDNRTEYLKNGVLIGQFQL